MDWKYDWRRVEGEAADLEAGGEKESEGREEEVVGGVGGIVVVGGGER